MSCQLYIDYTSRDSVFEQVSLRDSLFLALYTYARLYIILFIII